MPAKPMLVGILLISGWNWLVPAGFFLLIAVIVLLWGYRRASTAPWVHAVCLLLKLLGFVALLLCLLEPLWSGQRARPGANYFAIVADNSQGMQIKDQGATRSRGELLHELLTKEKGAWQGKLEENFQVRRYSFDSRLQFTKDFGDLQFDGRASSLGAALRTLTDRYRGQPLAGILLLTDGNATDLPRGVSDLSSMPPIYPVVIGESTPVTDVALQKVAVAQTAFEDAPVSIQADVTASGFSGADLVAQLVELTPTSKNVAVGQAPNLSKSTNSAASSTNKIQAPPGEANPPNLASPRERIVAEQTLKARRDGEPLAFRFQVRPEKSGIDFYLLRVAPKGEMDAFNRPDASSEATLANNSQILAIDRGRGPYRVLYATGRPNWEYKFFHRAIDEDDQVQLDAMIRVAKREPKMDFRGRAGESSNPLFRGFGSQPKDEVEQYDQAVVRWLIAKDEGEVHAGFPKTAEELYRYHAVILGDLESEFFTHDQMVLLQKFVSERGGGFLMLGGQESLGEGNYERTPIGEMLPVYLNPSTVRLSEDGYRLDLTREGWLQPWARLRNNEAAEKKRLTDTPPFFVVNQIREFKPGASVIATASDALGKSYPALVMQRFGNGRSAALAIGDLWHWGLRDKEVHRDLDKAWRQLVRWLVSDVPNRIELLVEPQASDPNQAVLLQVRVRNEKFQAFENAAVSILVNFVGHGEPGKPASPQPDSTKNKPTLGQVAGPIRLTAEPSMSEPGLYEATFIPRETGGYLAEAIVLNPVGAELGRAEAGWSSDPAAEEFKSLAPNRPLLEALAKRSGGEMISFNGLEAFARGLPHRQVPISENWTFPIWHQPLVFLFALGCFVAEWGLRRWKGLA